MSQDGKSDLTWQELAELVTKEKDSTRLLRLLEQLNAALDRDQQRLQAARRNPFLKLKRDSFPALLNQSLSLTDAEFGTFQLFDSALGQLRMIAGQGFDSEFLQHFDRVELDSCACGTVLKKRSRVVVSDVMTDPVFDDSSRGVLIRANAMSVQSTPIFGTSGELIGVVSTHCRKPRRVSPEQLQKLDGMISRFAAGIAWP